MGGTFVWLKEGDQYRFDADPSPGWKCGYLFDVIMPDRCPTIWESDLGIFFLCHTWANAGAWPAHARTLAEWQRCLSASIGPDFRVSLASCGFVRTRSEREKRTPPPFGPLPFLRSCPNQGDERPAFPHPGPLTPLQSWIVEALIQSGREGLSQCSYYAPNKHSNLRKALWDPVDAANTAIKMRTAIVTDRKEQHELQSSVTLTNRPTPLSPDWQTVEQRTIGWLEGAATQTGKCRLVAALLHCMHQPTSYAIRHMLDIIQQGNPSDARRGQFSHQDGNDVHLNHAARSPTDPPPSVRSAGGDISVNQQRNRATKLHETTIQQHLKTRRGRDHQGMEPEPPSLPPVLRTPTEWRSSGRVDTPRSVLFHLICCNGRRREKM